MFSKGYNSNHVIRKLIYQTIWFVSRTAEAIVTFNEITEYTDFDEFSTSSLKKQKFGYIASK